MFYLLTLCRQYVVKFLKSKQIILNIESNIYLNTLQLSDVIKWMLKIHKILNINYFEFEFYDTESFRQETKSYVTLPVQQFNKTVLTVKFMTLWQVPFSLVPVEQMCGHLSRHKHWCPPPPLHMLPWCTIRLFMPAFVTTVHFSVADVYKHNSGK